MAIETEESRIAVKSFTAKWREDLDKKVNKWLAEKDRMDIIKIDYFNYNQTVNSNSKSNITGLQQRININVSGFCALIVYYTNK